MKKNKKNISAYDLIGKTWLYKGKEYLIQNYQPKGEIHYVVSAQKWFEFSSDELACFLQDILPVEDEPADHSLAIITPQDEHGLVRPNSGSSNVMAYLKGILVEDIERVREDPAYVEQAKTSSNNVKRLIDIARLELSIQQINRKK